MMRGSILFAVLLSLSSASGQVHRRQGCSHDNCLRAFIRSSAAASEFCATYTLNAAPTHPTWAGNCDGEIGRVSSACSCLYPGTTLAPSTSASSSPSAVASTTVPSTSTRALPSTTQPPSTTSISVTSQSASFTASTSSSPATTSSGTSCTCTAYSQIAPAVAACTNIVLQDIAVPTNSSVNLASLLPNTVVTFAGLMTFDFTNSSTFDSIIIGGQNVTIIGAPGAIIDGNGPAYWDGIGSNGGVPKPNHFIVVKNVTAGSTITNLFIRNWPAHCFSISLCSDISFTNIFLDNTAGNAPNNRSNGLPAAHNSDGFDLASSNNTLISNNTVLNQDDCVAVTSGNNITVSDMYCSGGHGLSIGSIGGKAGGRVNNVVSNVLFTRSTIISSQNGPRIKTNYNTTGLVSNITYSNIQLSDISIYGIDVQQDYLNGGPTGSPSNGVLIENVLFENITGTADIMAKNYYVLCGDGSCRGLQFVDVDIEGGGLPSSCNAGPGQCPS